MRNVRYALPMWCVLLGLMNVANGQIVSDPGVRPMGGWPQTILGETNTWIGMVSPVITDLENDGTKELVITTQGSAAGRLSTLFIFEANGNIRSQIDVDYYLDPRTFPSIADIDKDGAVEIVMPCVGPSDNRILIFDAQGNLEDSLGIEFQMSDDLYSAAVLADVNRDSTLEIIYSGWYLDGARLVVLDNHGNTMPGFPVMLETNNGQCQANTPAVGNLDGDDEWEIVVSSHENGDPADTTNIRAYKADGSLLWSQYVSSLSSCDPVIGDVNNDGFNEVVFTSETGLNILDRNGNFLLQWSLSQGMAHSNVALADFDKDSDLEIVFQYEEQLYAVHHDSTMIFSYVSDWIGHHPPVVGDIDSDGRPDILFNSDSEIYALDITGAVMDSFPKPMDLIAYSSPSIDDIDNDGLVDVISSANWIEPDINVGIIYVWELPGSYQQSAMEWQMYQHDPQHTGYYHNGTVTDVSGGSPAIPQSMTLAQNYPNPCNPSTTIQYTIPVGTNGRTSLRVYEKLGREVATLVNETKDPGGYTVRWDASGFGSGVYFYRLQAGSFVSTRKMLLLK